MAEITNEFTLQVKVKFKIIRSINTVALLY